MWKAEAALRTLISSLFCAFVASSSALAADVPASTFDWSGFNAGVFGGGAWSGFHETELHTNAFGGGWWFPPGPNPSFSYRNSGTTFGVQAGWDRQIDNLVLGAGVEAGRMDISVKTVDPNTPPNPDPDGNIEIALSGGNFGSLTGRAGWAFDRLLIYARAGVSVMGARASTSDKCDEDFCGNLTIEAKGHSTLFGLTAGGGVEYALTDSISAALEYRLYKFDDFTVKGVANNLLTYRQTISPDIIHTVRMSINLRF